MKQAYATLVTLTALAAGCQIGEVTAVTEPVALPLVLGGFDDGGEGERLVGEVLGDELRLSPDLAAALAQPEITETDETGTTSVRQFFALHLVAGASEAAIDPADPVVRLRHPLGADDPIRLTVSDDDGPLATLELGLGDRDEAAEHGDDLIYYHTCGSGSGSWSLSDSRWAAGGLCNECGYHKRRWRHQVSVCHSCPPGSTSPQNVCKIISYQEYCDYC